MKYNKIDLKSLIIGFMFAFIIFSLFLNEKSVAGNGQFTIKLDDEGFYLLNQNTGFISYTKKSDCFKRYGNKALECN